MEIMIKDADKKKLGPEVSQIYMAWLEAKRYYKNQLDNTMENWRYYFAKFAQLGQGQWPQKIVDQMVQQERQILQYNFIMPTVDALAGSLLQVPFEPEFIPTDNVITSLTRVIKEAMYSDRELMDWKGAYLELVRAGLIGGGDIKIVISDEFSKLGNIGLEYQLPGSVLYSPLWKTWRTKDCKICWKESWYTAIEMAAKWGDKSDQIVNQARLQEQSGITYGPYTGITPYKTDDNSWGSSYRIIEQYKVVDRAVKRDYVITAGEEGKAKHTMVPDAVPFQDRWDWLNANVPDWKPEYVYTEPEVDKICKLDTVCPSLLHEEKLEHGEPEVQIGALPFKHWSATRANGEDHSIVDSVKDPQMNINFWESMAAHKIRTEGGGGAGFVDSSMFINNQEYLKFAHNRNKPTMNFKLKPGYLDKGIVPWKPVATSQFPDEIYKNIEHIIGVVWPHVSKVTPSTLGMREQGAEGMSGKLYNMMKIQSDLQAFTIHYGLRMFWNELYEGYLLQAGQTYSNEAIERIFPTEQGKSAVVLNERVDTGDGTIGIRNDASKLKEMRHKVIINEKQETPTKKAEDVEILTTIIKSLPPTRSASINYLTNEVVKKLDQIPPESKGRLEELGELELKRDIAQINAQIAQANIAVAQASQMPGATPLDQGAVTETEAGAPIGDPRQIMENLKQAAGPPPPGLGGSLENGNR